MFNLKSTLSVLLALGFMTMLTSLIPSGTVAAPPASGDWTVDNTNSETDNGLDFTMTGNITIQALGDLTLKNCTITFDVAFDSQYSFIVNTGGRLLMDNCTVRSSDPAFRYGFILQTQSDVTLMNSDIRDTDWAIQVHSNSAKITGCDISDSDRGVDIFQCSPQIRGNDIHDCDHEGIFVRDTSAPAISANKIHDNLNEGIYVWQGTPQIFDNEVYNNHNTGIIIEDAVSSFDVTNNIIRYNNGFGIHVEHCSVNLTQNTIQANANNGIMVYGANAVTTNPRIEQNLILGNEGNGIRLDDRYTSAQISDNSIYKNFNWGISSRGGHFTGTGNVFTDASGDFNRQGRIRQSWDLTVSAAINCVYYLYNSKLATNPTASWSTTNYDFGYLTDYEEYNNGTILNYGTYAVLADQSGGSYNEDYQTTPLDDNIDLVMTPSPAAELAVTAISFSNPAPVVGDTVTANIDVRNNGNSDANNVNVDIYLIYPDGRSEYLTTLTTIVTAGNTQTLTKDITFKNGGTYQVKAVADPNNAFWEDDDPDPAPTNNVRTSAGLTVTGYSCFITGVDTYINYPYWNWMTISESDETSVDPGQYKTYRVWARNYRTSNDRFDITMSYDPTWTVKATFDANTATNNLITNFNVGNGWNGAFYIHACPPVDAPRGSNANIQITLRSDNDSRCNESYHLDIYSNLVVPAGQTQTISNEAKALPYSIKVYGTLNLNTVTWTFDDYPQQKELTIYDGGAGSFYACYFTSETAANHWRFYVYGDLNLTESVLLELDYGIEVMTQNYPANVNIQNNFISLSNHDGISLDESFAHIAENIIERNAGAGIQGVDSYGKAIIHGNTIRSNNIGIAMNLKSFERTEIYINDIYWNAQGINLDSFTNVTSNGNHVWGNTIGMNIVNHATLESNMDRIDMNTQDGVQMDQYARAYFEDATIQYNVRYGISPFYYSEVEVISSSVQMNGQMALYAVRSQVEMADCALGDTIVHGNWNLIDDVVIDKVSSLTLTNTTIDRARLFFVDVNSTVLIQWYLQVWVHDKDDLGVPGVYVEVEDQASPVYSGDTGHTGITPVIIGREILLSPKGNVTYLVHTITVHNGGNLTQVVNLTTNLNVDFTLDYALKTIVLDAFLEADPLETVTYNLTLFNKGMLTDTYDIGVLGNDSWAPILDRTTITVLPGAYRNLTLNVTVPERALAMRNESFIVTFVSQNDISRKSSEEVFVLVGVKHGLEVVPELDDLSALPGNNITVRYHMTNTGSVPDTYTLKAQVAGTRIVPGDVQLSDTTIPLIAWEEHWVTVNLPIRNDTLTGMDELTLTVNSTDPLIGETIVLGIGVEQIMALEFTGNTSEVALIGGNSQTFDIVLTNMGNGPDYVQFYTDSPYVDLGLDKWNCQPGDILPMLVTVNVPIDAPTNSSIVTIRAVCCDNLTQAIYDFTLNVTARMFDVTLSAPQTEMTLEQGRLETLNLTLTNNGNDDDLAQLSHGGVNWGIVYARTSLALGPGQASDVEMVIHVPLTATIGDYTIDLSCASQGMTSYRTLTVHVIEKNINLRFLDVVQPGPVMQGKNVTVVLQINNNGNYTTTAYFGIQGTPGIASLDQAAQTISPGQAVQITLTITIPNSYKVPKQPITLRVVANYGLNNTKQAYKDVTVTVKEKPEESHASYVVLAIVLLVLGLIIGAVVVFFVVRRMTPKAAAATVKKRMIRKQKKRVKKKDEVSPAEGQTGAPPALEPELVSQPDMAASAPVQYSQEVPITPGGEAPPTDGKAKAGLGMLPPEESLPGTAQKPALPARTETSMAEEEPAFDDDSPDVDLPEMDELDEEK